MLKVLLSSFVIVSCLSGDNYEKDDDSKGKDKEGKDRISKHGKVTYSPTYYPSYTPTYGPTITPSYSPSDSPTITPTMTPTMSPTDAPTKRKKRKNKKGKKDKKDKDKKNKDKKDSKSSKSSSKNSKDSKDGKDSKYCSLGLSGDYYRGDKWEGSCDCADPIVQFKITQLAQMLFSQFDDNQHAQIDDTTFEEWFENYATDDIHFVFGDQLAAVEWFGMEALNSQSMDIETIGYSLLLRAATGILFEFTNSPVHFDYCSKKGDEVRLTTVTDIYRFNWNDLSEYPASQITHSVFTLVRQNNHWLFKDIDFVGEIIGIGEKTRYY